MEGLDEMPLYVDSMGRVECTCHDCDCDGDDCDGLCNDEGCNDCGND